MGKGETFSKKGNKNQEMGVQAGLVAKKANESKGSVKKNVPMKSKNKGKGKNVAVPKSVGKNKNSKVLNKKELKPKVEELEEEVDSEIESDDQSMEESPQKKGIKMFEGLRNSNDEESDAEQDVDSEDELSVDEEDDDDDDEDDDDDDEDDDDDDDEEDGKKGLKALLGESIVEEDDDDSFAMESEGDDEAVAAFDKKLRNKSKVKDEDDDDEEEEDDESEDEEDEKGLGLKDLLGDSLVDEEDDSDFDDEGQDEEDEDISDESDGDVKNESLEKSTPPKKKKVEGESPKRLSREEQAKLDARTIYVGNVPKDTLPKAIKQLFRSCGEIENVRIRGVVAEDSRVSPKVATITKKMHPKVQTVYVYVAFKDEASAKKALEFNGKKLGDNILRVDLSNTKNQERDQKKAVFLGNLPFDITEDEIHAHFATCGKIDSVRLIKHRKTGLSRGVGYINFAEADSVTLALELNDTKLKNRQIRVNNSSPEKQNKKRKMGNKQGIVESGTKKLKNEKGQPKVTNGDGKSEKKKRSQGTKKREQSSGNESSSPSSAPVKSPFQGQQAGEKKKSKNKQDKKKKIMSEKLTSAKKSKG